MLFQAFVDAYKAKFGREPVVFVEGSPSELRIEFYFDKNHVRHVSADWKGFTLISRNREIKMGFWVGRDYTTQPFRADDPAGIVDLLVNVPAVGSAAVLLECVARVLEREGYIKTA
jgi:hypothetical protein